MKRFITYLDGLARRTSSARTVPSLSALAYSGTSSKGPEGLLGFFGLVILPAMAAPTLYHFIFD